MQRFVVRGHDSGEKRIGRRLVPTIQIGSNTLITKSHANKPKRNTIKTIPMLTAIQGDGIDYEKQGCRKLK
jgi:hypothetical protein